ncbi:hypothetical protein ILYODFUR_028184 [Ilyodon furcidens]|uniref:Uncharacterized protein n=1 Tax=Ilyodon furcidens TaxID=33524 RepID=A0ABV0V7I4_9TELE
MPPNPNAMNPVPTAPGHTSTGELQQGKGPTQLHPSLCHRRNMADAVEHRAHNGTPDPTSTWNKLTRQEVPGQRQAIRTGISHHAPTITQTHHITATATITQVETLSSSALPSPLSRANHHSKCAKHRVPGRK